MNRAFLFALLFAPGLLTAGQPTPTGSLSAQRFPYSMIGQLTFVSGDGEYVGSGTVVQPRGVLTAGHNLYDSQGGWSTDLLYKRGHYDRSDLTVRRPGRIWILGGYQNNVNTFGTDSVAAFSLDTGGAAFAKNVAGGSYLGWSTDLSLLTRSNTPKLTLGYGALVHNGEELLASSTTNAFSKVHQGFYEAAGLGIEGGMSGGPVLCRDANGALILTGTVVSGTDFPVAGGIRIINLGVSNFILRYLSAP